MKEKRYILTVKPAIDPVERHKIEDVLKEMGYKVSGGGTHTDHSECDISFGKEIQEIGRGVSSVQG